jgi:hypothetical protein
MSLRVPGLTVVAVMLLVSLSGCGVKPVPVRGVVTLDGAPLAGASVRFVRDEHVATDRPGVAVTKEDGSFELASFGAADGVLPGQYRVVVTKFKAPPLREGKPADPETIRDEKMARLEKKFLLPELAVYADPATTPLRCTVPPDGPVTLELSSHPKP